MKIPDSRLQMRAEVTISEAKAALSKPLEFGNKSQIEARDFLERVADLRARLNAQSATLIECGHCDGTGEDAIECFCGLAGGWPDPDCTECQGDGVIEVDCEQCAGTGYCSAESQTGDFEETNLQVIKAAKSSDSLAFEATAK